MKTVFRNTFAYQPFYENTLRIECPNRSYEEKSLRAFPGCNLNDHLQKLYYPGQGYFLPKETAIQLIIYCKNNSRLFRLKKLPKLNKPN